MAEDKSWASKLKSFALKSLRSREVGACEAAYRVCTLQMHGASAEVKFLSTNLPKLRNRRLKDYKELKDHTTIEAMVYANLQDVYYINRGREMEDICLYYVAINYTFNKKTCPSGKNKQCECRTRCYNLWVEYSGDGCFKHRTKPAVLKTEYYTMDEAKREQYFHQLLMLFKPYRDEEKELLGSYETYFEAYEAAKAATGQLSEMVDEFVDSAQQVQDMKDLKKQLTMEVIQEEVPDINRQMQAVEDTAVATTKEITPDKLLEMEDSFSPEQHLVYNKITNHLLSSADKRQPLRLFVSGEGGTG